MRWRAEYVAKRAKRCDTVERVERRLGTTRPMSSAKALRVDSGESACVR